MDNFLKLLLEAARSNTATEKKDLKSVSAVAAPAWFLIEHTDLGRIADVMSEKDFAATSRKGQLLAQYMKTKRDYMWARFGIEFADKIIESKACSSHYDEKTNLIELKVEA